MKTLILVAMFGLVATPAFASNPCDTTAVKTVIAQQITDIEQRQMPGISVIDIINVTTIAFTPGVDVQCHMTVLDSDDGSTNGMFKVYPSKMDPNKLIAEFIVD